MNRHPLRQILLFGCGLAMLLSWRIATGAPAPIVTSIQDNAEGEEETLGLGLTVSLAKRPFVGVKDQTALLPYVSYRYQRFYVEGLDLGLHLHQKSNYRIDLLATPRFFEVKPGFADAGELNGIDQTNPTYFAGVSAHIRTDAVSVTAQVLHDVLESDGNELVLQFGKTYRPRSTLSLSPSLGLTYQDARLVDYFYGVQANEVAAGRPQYAGRAALNYNVTLNASWRLYPQWDVLGQLKYERLGDGISDSPIVNESWLYYLTLGAVYRF